MHEDPTYEGFASHDAPLPKLQRKIEDARHWFLINAEDQMGHLDDAGCITFALYVGRRVEHVWRELDDATGRAIGDLYPQTRVQDDPRAADDLKTLTAAVRALPAVPAAEASVEDWVRCARGNLQAAGDAVNAMQLSVRSVAVQMRIAREAFSRYRVAKYRWTALAYADEPETALVYQVLEA
jgi:hypothetical protein